MTSINFKKWEQGRRAKISVRFTRFYSAGTKRIQAERESVAHEENYKKLGEIDDRSMAPQASSPKEKEVRKERNIERENREK